MSYSCMVSSLPPVTTNLSLAVTVVMVAVWAWWVKSALGVQSCMTTGHTRTEKNKWRLYLTSQMKPLNWQLLNKTYCSPTYFAISFYSVTEGNLLVAPSNQLQYSCHAVACSNSRLSCSQLVRLVWFSFLYSLKIDKDTYWQHENILIRTKRNKFERIYLLKKASSAHKTNACGCGACANASFRPSDFQNKWSYFF